MFLNAGKRGGNRGTPASQTEFTPTNPNPNQLWENALTHPLAAQTLRKVTLRLIPFLFILYVGAFLDRVNVSVAKLTMVKDLHYSDTVFNTGAGIFFVGYFFFEVPSNLIMARMGARVWIARIMLSWGIISSLMMFAHSPFSFYSLRFLLGVAEAGFFPGMIYYLTNWYPAHERARAISRFMLAIPIAYMIGNPLGGLFLHLDGLNGWRGWQWLFLLEGIPSVVLGIVTLFYLTDSPDKAHWLEPEEKTFLIDTLIKERQRKEERHSLTWLQALGNPRVMMLCLLYFSIVVGGYGMSMNLPDIVNGLVGSRKELTFWVASIPYACGAVAMILVSLNSDRTHERRFHVAMPAFIGAIGITLTALSKNPIPSLIGLCLANIGQTSTLAPFWALSTSFLGGLAAAGAIAFINSVGNLGGYFGPLLMGKIKDRTHSYEIALLILAGILALAGVLAILAHHDPSLERIPTEEEEEGILADSVIG